MNELGNCPKCSSELRLRHTHSYCSVGGALTPTEPAPDETWCNTEHDDGSDCAIPACSNNECDNYLGIYQ